MRLPSLSSSYIFNFPSDFLLPEVVNNYNGFIEYYHMPYDNIIDYINSTIRTVTCPGLSINVAEQRILRGKVMAYKPSTPVQDIFTSHEFTVTFNSIDGHANYMLLLEIFQKHYLDTDNLYIKPFIVTFLDPWRNAIYRMEYHQLIAISLSDILLDNSVQKISFPEFTLTFRFNFMNLEFLMNKDKIIDIGNKAVLGNSSPIILNK